MFNFVTLSFLLSVFCANFVQINAEDVLPIQVEIFRTDLTLECSVEHGDINRVSVEWVRELRDGTEEQVSKGTRPIGSYKDRVEVNKPKANDWNLKFNNITKDLEGNYVCSSYIKTDVKELKRYNISVVPKRNDDVNDQPATIVVNMKYGEDANISCSTSQPGQVVWYKKDDDGDRSKDVPIPKGLNVTHKGNTWTLTLPSVNSTSNGFYVCKIDEFDIAIHQIVVAIRKVIVENRKNKEFICVLPNHITSDLYGAISWNHNGTKIYRSRVTNNAGTSILKLERVTPTVSDGIYECIYKNKLIENCIYQLEVHTPPFVDDQNTPAVVNVNEYELANLTCNILGKPEPEITWFRIQKVKNSIEERIKVQGKILLIPNITRYAADKYICEGKNNIGNIRHEINVEVLFKPEIEVLKQEVRICRYMNVNLRCLVQTSIQLDKSNVQWNRCWEDCRPIPNNYLYQIRIDQMEGYPVHVVTLTLLIKNNNEEHNYSGNYTCKVSTHRNEVTSKDIVVKDTRHTDEGDSDVEVGPYC